MSEDEPTFALGHGAVAALPAKAARLMRALPAGELTRRLVAGNGDRGR